VQLHAFEAAATGATPAFTFRSPLGNPQIAPAIADAVQSIHGLDTRPHYRPHLMHSASNGKLVRSGRDHPMHQRARISHGR